MFLKHFMLPGIRLIDTHRSNEYKNYSNNSCDIFLFWKYSFVVFTEPAFELVSVNIRQFEWQLHGLSKSFLLNSKTPSAACFILCCCLYFLLAPCQTALLLFLQSSSLQFSTWDFPLISVDIFIFFFFCPYL